MKIVHVMSWYIPDMGYQENYLPAEQAKFRHDVRIICSGKTPSTDGFNQVIGNKYPNRIIGIGEFEDKGVKIYRLPSFEVSGQVALIGLRKKLRELKPDVIQLHGAFAPTTIRVLLCNELSGKIFIDDHSHENNINVDIISSRLYLSIVKVVYLIRSDKVLRFLPVTDSSSRILKKILKINEHKMTPLPLGAKVQVLSESKAIRDEYREKMGLQQDDILIITAGKFTQNKDIHILIEAFNLAFRDNPHLKLLLIGNGPKSYMMYLKELIEKYKLADRIMTMNFVSNQNLPYYFQAADIGIWPGDHSITAIEAVATGLPVIIPKDDEAYRILLDNKVGVGFERRNIQSLKISMTTLTDSSFLRNNI